jgi:hypothetical protein
VSIIALEQMAWEMCNVPFEPVSVRKNRFPSTPAIAQARNTSRSRVSSVLRMARPRAPCGRRYASRCRPASNARRQTSAQAARAVTPWPLRDPPRPALTRRGASRLRPSAGP